MLMRGIPDRIRLIVCDLLSWILQKDPKKRPRSCEEMLRHPFFLDSEEHSLDTLSRPPPEGLHLTRLHIAAALGEIGEVKSTLGRAEAMRATSAGGRRGSRLRLLSPGKEELLHRHPLHLAGG